MDEVIDRSPMDVVFSSDGPLGGAEEAGRDIGRIVSGSLAEGLTARLDAGVSVEDMAVGRYVVIDGQKRRFFGMVTDVKLGSASDEITSAPPDVSDPFVAEVIAGTSTYGIVTLQPMLTLEQEGGDMVPKPVKTIPPHFSRLRDANEEDVSIVFGEEDERHFYVGKPLDMDTRVCIDLKRLTERSTGVFGKSGTGKTFITRTLLSGLVQRDACVNLVFDMHNEYGWEGTAENESGRVPALQRFFGRAKVAIFTLDEDSSRKRGVNPDFVVELGLDQITPADIETAQEALGLSDPQLQAMFRLTRGGDRDWLGKLLDLAADEVEHLAQDQGLPSGTVHALVRRLDTRIARLSFVKRHVAGNSVAQIVDYLSTGKHVVLEFGRLESLDAYMLVANILTRRIREAWVDKMESAMGDKNLQPRPLVITIEEAHRFLNPKVADLTIFGTIAREMRKYNVTLLVIDQRPSSIADEIMSQIGTRITCLLDDDKDTAAVLSGIPGANNLKSILARLETRQQALILGHSVPMPVVIRTRDYADPEFLAEMGASRTSLTDGDSSPKQVTRRLSDLFS